MTTCSQYAAAFGFQLYLVPVQACGLDLSTVSGGLKAGGFFNPVATLSETIKIEEGAAGEILAGDPGVNVVYDGETQTSEYVFKMRGLTNAGLETDTGSEAIQTYDEEGRGFDQSVAISKSWTMAIEGVSKFDDAAYKVLRIVEASAVSGQLAVKIGRIGPTGTTEACYGYARVVNYSESIESGSIVTWSAELQGYGPLTLDLDNAGTVNVVGPAQTLSILNAGSNLLDTTYTDQALTGGNGNGLATADIIVSGGVVSDVQLTDGGDNYQELDVLTADLQGAIVTGVLDDPLTISNPGVNLAFYDNEIRNVSGGNGTNGQVLISADGGVLTSAVVSGNGGEDYQVGDVLTVLGLVGLPNPDFGAVLSFTNLQGGANYADGTFAGTPLTGGSGTNLTADLTVAGGVVTAATIVDGGENYNALETFTAALAPAVIPGTGQVLTFTTTDAGSNLADGSFTAVAVSGGSGTQLSMDITVSGGVVTAATLNNSGVDYVAGDSGLTADLGGVITPGTGEVLTANTGTVGSGLVDGSFTAVATTTNGGGADATVDVVIASGQLDSFVINNGGTGYSVGETLTVQLAGGGTLPTLLITSVDEDSEQAHTDPTFTVDTVDEDTDAVVTAWSVQAATVDENDRLVPTAPEVTVTAVTTRQDAHTDPTFRVTSLVDNDQSGG
ncbi:MAG: phage tail tube protein [Synechococcus sp.]